MHCSSCGSAAQPGARFCVECGLSLGRRCAACGQDNPADAKFCAGCGSGLVAADPLRSDASFAPTAAKPAPNDEVAERRPLTVMFCDLVDSTIMSTRLDPEDYRDVIFAYQRTVADEIGRSGGFVAKYMGDGVLAYFGYPAAQEDDAERSVRAGLKVAAAVEALPSPSGTLQARIGVATGSVIIGELMGEGAAREHAIAGETPNLAARLQGLADRGGVVICGKTHALVGGLFDYAPLGPVMLKGFDQPQPAFRVQAVNERMSRFEALRSQGSGFIGREEELSILSRRWKRILSGEPQILLASADAGVGKSRLVATFRHELAGGDQQTLTAYCAPYARDTAFHPFLRSLEARFGFSAADSGEDKRRKLEAGLQTVLGRTNEENVDLLGALLSLPAPSGRSVLQLTPQRQREEATLLLAELVLSAGTERPTLMFVEDAHWIDPSSQDVLRAIARDLRPGVKFMLILSYRPEYQPPAEWFGQPNVTLITLPRLRNEDAQTMLAQIVGRRDLAATVSDQILAHADGVPLYIEEIARAVIERRDATGATSADADDAAIRVPPTLQASLLSRLDRLTSSKEIAQIGAAIGRDFPRNLLSAVAHRSEQDLDAALTELVKSDLIVAIGSGANRSYVFRHALIQDVAYGALLRGPRLALHDRIATALIEDLPDQSQARPEILARHLSEAGRWREACEAWRRAATRTLRTGSWKEGLRQLEAGLKAVAALPDDTLRDGLELDLQMMVGGVAQGAVGHSAPMAQAAYERAYDIATRLGDHRNAALAGSRLWLALYGAGDLQGVEKSIRSVHEQLHPKDAEEDALILGNLFVPLQFMGRISELEELLRRLDPYLDWNKREIAPEEYYYLSPSSHVQSALLIVNLVTGRHHSWLETCQETRDLLKGMGVMGEVIGLTMLIYTRYVAGDWEGLKTDLSQFAGVHQRIEGAGYYLDLVRLVEARLATRSGDKAALEQIKSIMSSPAVAFAMQHLPRYQLIAGDAYVDVGDLESARGCFFEAAKGGPHGSQLWLRSELERRLGDLVAPTEPTVAQGHYRRALDVARSQSALLFELRAALAIARLEVGVESDAELRAVCDRFTEDGPDLSEALDFLKGLSAADALTRSAPTL